MNKNAVQIYVWKPSYYRELYERELEECREIGKRIYATNPDMLVLPKWKLDVLLILLESSKNQRIPRKYLRRMIKDDLKRREK